MTTVLKVLFWLVVIWIALNLLGPLGWLIDELIIEPLIGLTSLLFIAALLASIILFFTVGALWAGIFAAFAVFGLLLASTLSLLWPILLCFAVYLLFSRKKSHSH